MPICYIFNDRGERLIRFNADTREFGSKIHIGRSVENQISVAQFSDMYVSRFHFILHASGKKWYVQDSNSRWGIRKNGRKVKNAEVVPGDVIRFSHMFLCFGEKTGPACFDVVWQPEYEASECRMVLWPGVNTIGASVDNTVTLSGADGVSRYHAVIEVINNRRLTIHKDHDTALTAVNGKPVGASAEIQAGDRITLGNTVVKVVYRPRMETEATVNLSKYVADERIHRRHGSTGPQYAEAGYRTKVIYVIMTAAVIAGLAALTGIVFALF